MATDIYGSTVYDIPRQSSKCRIVVYSHITENEGKSYRGVIDCSDDVVDCGRPRKQDVVVAFREGKNGQVGF